MLVFEEIAMVVNSISRRRMFKLLLFPYSGKTKVIRLRERSEPQSKCDIFNLECLNLVGLLKVLLQISMMVKVVCGNY